MLNTVQNSASVLSIGFFFTIISLGLASKLPSVLYSGLTRQGVSPQTALAVSHISPLGSLFAAFLGINPMQQLLGAKVLSAPGVHASTLTGQRFFPSLISGPFGDGLHLALLLAAALCILGAIFSWLRGADVNIGIREIDAHASALQRQESETKTLEVALSSPSAQINSD